MDSSGAIEQKFKQIFYSKKNAKTHKKFQNILIFQGLIYEMKNFY